MIFDTDVLIWSLRGNQKAATLIESDWDRSASVISSMELYRGSRNKMELKLIHQFLKNFEIIPLSENIGHRASIYVEQLTLNKGLEPLDALIASTAVEYRMALCTANVKHYRAITDLDLKTFRV